MNNDITIHLFGESVIRNVIENGVPKFVIADLCKALDLSNPTMVAERIHPEDLSTAEVFTQTGSKTVNVCNESGLYQLIFQSRKPAAKDFTRWVTSEVLPSIRKKGFYSHRTDQLLSFVRELMDMGATFKEASILARGEFPPLTRKEQRMQEIEQHNAEITADPEAECFLSIMQPGIQYRLKDFFTVLPTDSRILQIKTPKGRDTAIGTVMERLCRLGRVRRINARHATFELVVDNVVSIQR